MPTNTNSFPGHKAGTRKNQPDTFTAVMNIHSSCEIFIINRYDDDGAGLTRGKRPSCQRSTNLGTRGAAKALKTELSFESRLEDYGNNLFLYRDFYVVVALSFSRQRIFSFYPCEILHHLTNTIFFSFKKKKKISHIIQTLFLSLGSPAIQQSQHFGLTSCVEQ